MSKSAFQPLEAIRQQGYRLTPQRQVILDVVAAIGDHCTPEAVYRQVRTKAPAMAGIRP